MDQHDGAGNSKDWPVTQTLLTDFGGGPLGRGGILAHTEVAKTHEYTTLLIPQAEAERFEARQQGDWLNCRKKRISLVTSLQMIVGNARAQVMDVMEPNVAGEPL